MDGSDALVYTAEGCAPFTITKGPHYSINSTDNEEGIRVRGTLVLFVCLVDPYTFGLPIPTSTDRCHFFFGLVEGEGLDLKDRGHGTFVEWRTRLIGVSVSPIPSLSWNPNPDKGYGHQKFSLDRKDPSVLTFDRFHVSVDLGQGVWVSLRPSSIKDETKDDILRRH